MGGNILINIYDYYITSDEYAEAEKNGVNYLNVTQRIRKYGWRKNITMTKPIGKWTNRKSLSAFANENGISHKILIGRLGNGWDEWRLQRLLFVLWKSKSNKR